MGQRLGRLSNAARDALVKIYNSGGGSMWRIDSDNPEVMDRLYSGGHLASHRNLCSKYAHYQLTKKGIEKASQLAGE